MIRKLKTWISKRLVAYGSWLMTDHKWARLCFRLAHWLDKDVRREAPIVKQSRYTR
jgi:hypothetical protein